MASVGWAATAGAYRFLGSYSVLGISLTSLFQRVVSEGERIR